MSYNDSTLVLNWTGPWSWPQFEHENGLSSVPSHAGIYLFTFEYDRGYLIYAAGITRRAIPTRLREHTRNYIRGDYNVLDIADIRVGIRSEVWHGWGWTPQKRNEFENRKEQILDAVRRQLTEFRIFVASIDLQPRLLERLEASIMFSLYDLPVPLCNLPDRGMHLAGRWNPESPVIVRNECTSMLHGLPSEMYI